MSNLDQSLLDLVAKHDLLSVNFTLLTTEGHEPWFNASVQWDRHGARQISSHNGDTVTEALSKAVAGMLLQRGQVEPVPLADEAIQIGEAA